MAARRVLWLAKGLGLGGTEQRLVRALPLIDQNRFEIEVAYLLPWKDALVPALERLEVPTYCLQAGRALDLRWASRLRRLVASRHYDLIHTLMPYPAVIARLAVHGPALVHTEPNMWTGYRRATAWANALTYRRNKAAIAVSQAVADTIKAPLPRWPMPPVEVIVHGIDPAEVRMGDQARREARALLGFEGDELLIGVVASLTPKKDHATLLQAFTTVVAEEPRARLVLIGGGRLEKTLREQVEGLGVTDTVTFLGSRTDVLRLLPAFDVVALSSRHEGLPIAIVEALATGVPVVATSVGGVPELVEDGREGFLVAAGDARGMAHALAKILSDDALRQDMAAAALARGREADLASAIGHTQEIYERVLAP